MYISIERIGKHFAFAIGKGKIKYEGKIRGGNHNEKIPEASDTLDPSRRGERQRYTRESHKSGIRPRSRIRRARALETIARFCFFFLVRI